VSTMGRRLLVWLHEAVSATGRQNNAQVVTAEVEKLANLERDFLVRTGRMQK